MNLQRIDPEQLAYWFFRLNGCLTITNFMLHRSKPRSGNHTDGDILAVRFPYRVELEKSEDGAMIDHQIFTSVRKLITFDIVEVKRGRLTHINDTWLENKVVVEEFIKRIGFFQLKDVSAIASDLHSNWSYKNGRYFVRVIAIAQNKNPNKTEMPVPEAQQLTWTGDILPFIYDRLKVYGKYKADHSGWDALGGQLYEWIRYDSNTSKEEFTEIVMKAMRL